MKRIKGWDEVRQDLIKLTGSEHEHVERQGCMLVTIYEEDADCIYKITERRIVQDPLYSGGQQIRSTLVKSRVQAFEKKTGKKIYDKYETK